MESRPAPTRASTHTTAHGGGEWEGRSRKSSAAWVVASTRTMWCIRETRVPTRAPTRAHLKGGGGIGTTPTSAQRVHGGKLNALAHGPGVRCGSLLHALPSRLASSILFQFFLVLLDDAERCTYMRSEHRTHTHTRERDTHSGSRGRELETRGRTRKAKKKRRGQAVMGERVCEAVPDWAAQVQRDGGDAHTHIHARTHGERASEGGEEATHGHTKRK